MMPLLILVPIVQRNSVKCEVDMEEVTNRILDRQTDRQTDRQVFHCLFEQSGTFKNEFKKLGYKAYDYDIQNEFGETDYQIDLFAEIVNAYLNKPSIFDSFTKNDLIIAFFPCVRFENQIMLSFRGQSASQKNWNYEKKMEYDMKLLDELNTMYKYVNYMFIVCIRKGLRLVMENPYSEEHFLRRYWCYLPSIIDRDRRDNGDYFKKPTQYWFLNCKPKNNLLWEAIPYNAIQCKDAIKRMNNQHYKCTGAKSQKTARSIIHPDYANRFIRQYLIQGDTQ